MRVVCIVAGLGGGGPSMMTLTHLAVTPSKVAVAIQ